MRRERVRSLNQALIPDAMEVCADMIHDTVHREQGDSGVSPWGGGTHEDVETTLVVGDQSMLDSREHEPG